MTNWMTSDCFGDAERRRPTRKLPKPLRRLPQWRADSAARWWDPTRWRSPSTKSNRPTASSCRFGPPVCQCQESCNLNTSESPDKTSCYTSCCDWPHRRRSTNFILGHTFVLIPHCTSIYFSMSNVLAHVPKKCPFPPGDLHAWFIWLKRVYFPEMAYQSVQPFCRADRVTNTQTDRPRYFVCNSRLLWILWMATYW